MNEQSEYPLYEPEVNESVDIPDQDDRYPGSFFKIPRPLALGKSSWSLS